MQQAKWQKWENHTLPKSLLPLSLFPVIEKEKENTHLTGRDAVAFPSLLYMVLYVWTVRQNRSEQGRDGTDMPLSQTPGNP